VTPPPTVHGDLAAPATSVIGAAIARDRRRVLADLLALAKPRVVLMILVTTAVGYYAGLTGAPDYARLLHVLVGTLLAAGGALALNQYWERDVDARMERTRARPLPDGRLAPLEALLFGSALTALGLVYIGAFVGELAFAITLATAALYLFAYTPLKRRTPLCTLVGAVPGALPPVTGWVAAREGFGVGAWVLFGILFLWQLPHTLAIARLYRDDYARAGVRLLPVVDADGSSTERQIVTGCLALLVVSLLPTLIGIAGPVYFVGAFLLGAAFVALGARQALVPSTVAARRVLFASLLYLPALLALLAFDKV
jgi:protoheme IX farnesyltransferase